MRLFKKTTLAEEYHNLYIRLKEKVKRSDRDCYDEIKVYLKENIPFEKREEVLNKILLLAKVDENVERHWFQISILLVTICLTIFTTFFSSLFGAIGGGIFSSIVTTVINKVDNNLTGEQKQTFIKNKDELIEALQSILGDTISYFGWIFLSVFIGIFVFLLYVGVKDFLGLKKSIVIQHVVSDYLNEIQK